MINLKKFKNKEIFDRNYFLYFEEFDLCKSTNDKGGQVYSSSDLKVYHLGFKGSLGSKNSLKNEANKLRDWHWMWSSFYYHKKYSNYSLAIKVMLGKFIKSFFKMIFFTIIFNKKKKTMYYEIFSGLLN